jgi:glucose-6-phosphate isomerase
MRAIIKGVTATYRKQKLPFVSIELQKLNEQELGLFFQTRMMQTMYIGDLMNVNAFDQPSVEMYKEETRKALN